MLSHFLESLSPPPQHAEKMTGFHGKIRKNVPQEFQNDPIYTAPSVQDEDNSKATKQVRREHRAAMALAAKTNSDRRGAADGGTGVKKRKTTSATIAVV
jgi:hypothetical protein